MAVAEPPVRMSGRVRTVRVVAWVVASDVMPLLNTAR